MPGRVGGTQRTVKNVWVYKIDPVRNLMWVRGQVLLDSLKQEAYNDELKKKELLNWLKGLRSYQMSRRHGPFTSRFPHSKGDDKDPLGEFKRIAYKKWP